MLAQQHTPTTMAKKRTDTELQEASNHLLNYEFSMLMSVAQALKSGIAIQGWLHYALLESFLIHGRILIDFFYPPKSSRPDDVLASDYFDDIGDWGKIRPTRSEGLDRVKKRADKELAHLTYVRLDVTTETKGWDFIEIANEIQRLMEIFLKKVPKSRLCSQVEHH